MMILVTEIDPVADKQYQKKLADYLSSEDYNLYLQVKTKNTELWQSYVEQNLISTEYEYEEVFVPELNENISIEVKIKTIINPGVAPSQVIIHPEYSDFLSRLPPDLQSTNFVTVISVD
jgi:hypothetical protein